MCYRSMPRPCVAYGGFPLGMNIKDLGKGCDILKKRVVGTARRQNEPRGSARVCRDKRIFVLIS